MKEEPLLFFSKTRDSGVVFSKCRNSISMLLTEIGRQLVLDIPVDICEHRCIFPKEHTERSSHLTEPNLSPVAKSLL